MYTYIYKYTVKFVQEWHLKWLELGGMIVDPSDVYGERAVRLWAKIVLGNCRDHRCIGV